MADRVFQFKVTIKEIAPIIWRRILVPESYSFWDLHVAVQDALGWLDYHLHVFKIHRKHSSKATEIGIPNEDRFEDEPEILAGWNIPIADYFYDVGVSADYDYDFGDGWQHEIVLEGILLRETGQKYPQCRGGENACPPEDCGGVPGYYRLLEVLSDPRDDEYEGMVAWLGKKYDPQEFKPDKVKFDNPKKRWGKAFSGR